MTDSETPASMNTGRPDWDEELAETVIGATVIVGLTTIGASGQVAQQIQMHGTITKASPNDGIVIALAGKRAGETYTLPPHLQALTPAKAGEYRLRSTGEVIVDPDYTTSWTINKPNN